MGMLDKSEYTVGWICAIKTEYVAAQAFLEEEHGPPSRLSQHDSNDYTLGSIGHHNVVIAVLPNGGYGKSSAATVANNMLHSFPNVRIGLMVGIAGGVPSPRHDIRLGDVVVSCPSGGYSGVFQYDFGKSIQNRSFFATGFLNSPPTALRTASAGLEASYERKGHKIKEDIASLLRYNPRMRAKYSRPDPRSDILFASDCTHPPHDKRTCLESCPGEGVICRKPRSTYQDDPAIHYGLIASGDTLMKDAVARDRLAAQRDVLCFEMEAAGLMNSFPCLVIRGICDYSDSHKNKEWQGYAAMTAAAYARDVLMRLSPSTETETRAGKSMSSYNESYQDYGTDDEENSVTENREKKEELGEIEGEDEDPYLVDGYEDFQSTNPGYSAAGNWARNDEEDLVTKVDRGRKKKKGSRQKQGQSQFIEAENSGWSEWSWSEDHKYWYRSRTNDEGETAYEMAQ